MNRTFNYYTVDVFTNEQFGGNQLAVVVCDEPDSLSSDEMQNIAREFNYSETTFVLPPDDDSLYASTTRITAKLRIFTIGMELPFAGHPNVGSAYVIGKLATQKKKLFGKDICLGKDNEVIFEEKAGLVHCELNFSSDNDFVTISAPEKFTRIENSNKVKPMHVAECLSIENDEVMNVQFGSCGLPFLLAQLSSKHTLKKCVPNSQKFKDFQQLLFPGVGIHVFCICDKSDDVDVRVRMFFPDLGMILEDPATGSANCALVGHLGNIEHDLAKNQNNIVIAQGVEMGRPSCLKGVYMADGQVSIGGNVVDVMSGFLKLK